MVSPSRHITNIYNKTSHFFTNICLFALRTIIEKRVFWVSKSIQNKYSAKYLEVSPCENPLDVTSKGLIPGQQLTNIYLKQLLLQAIRKNRCF